MTSDWEQRVRMVELDNRLRRIGAEGIAADAERRLDMLEAKAGLSPDAAGRGPVEPEQSDAERRLNAIRAVLEVFDWERDDWQFALEKIERIAFGQDPV